MRKFEAGFPQSHNAVETYKDLLLRLSKRKVETKQDSVERLQAVCCRLD